MYACRQTNIYCVEKRENTNNQKLQKRLLTEYSKTAKLGMKPGIIHYKGNKIIYVHFQPWGTVCKG